MDEVEGCWVEVKPLLTSDIKPRNFTPILDSLYASLEPLRFRVADAEDPTVKGRRTVRFFVQFASRIWMEQFMNLAKVLLDVEAVEAEPPRKSYKRCVDLELAKDFARPIALIPQSPQVNMVDKIVSVIAGTGIAVDVVACGEPKASGWIERYIYELTNPQASFKGALLSHLNDMLSAFRGRSSTNTDREREAPYKESPLVREVVKHAETKRDRSLFICSLRIYGDDPEKIEIVKNTFPSMMNRFRTFKTQRKPADVETELKKPSRYIMRNLVLSRLYWITPLAIMALSVVSGLWDPRKIIVSPKLNPTDITVISTIILSATILFAFFRKHNIIVLSSEELSEIVGLPSSIEKLPVAFGQTPTVRMQLGQEQAKPTEEEEKKLEPKEERKQAETGGDEGEEPSEKKEEKQPVYGKLEALEE